MFARVAVCVSALVVLSAAPARAETALVISAANLRSSPATDQAVVAKLPAGTTVQVTHCREWCAVDWQGKKGFVIATAIDRNAGAKSALDAPRSTYEAPQRYYGPTFWSYGPDFGPYRGTSGIGYRGRW